MVTKAVAVVLEVGMYGVHFWTGFALEDAIEFHAFAPLEALACV